MIRLVLAAALLAAVAAPAFACPYDQSVSTESKSRTVAAQPSDDQGTPPPAAATDRKPS